MEKLFSKKMCGFWFFAPICVFLSVFLLLNGIGNIALSMGDYVTADSVFRQALKGEQQLGSTLGQAINYANLGAIFERLGKLDSAWTYYRLSLQKNIEADSQLGISLCHGYFGGLYEKQGDFDNAVQATFSI